MKRVVVVSFNLIMLLAVGAGLTHSAGVYMAGDDATAVPPKSEVEASIGQQLIVEPPDPVDWWPMYSHDLTHTSYSASTAPETDQILWNTTISGPVMIAAPAVVDGKVYVGTFVWAPTPAQVLAFDATTGELIWSFNMTSYSASGMQSSPAVADGIVYVDVFVYGFSGIYALNATTGSFIWSYPVGVYGVNYGSPAVAYGKVYIGGDNSWNVYALNATTGAYIWSYYVGSNPTDSTPAVADGKVYIDANGFYALNATTGALIWWYGGDYMQNPAIADGKVYVGSAGNKVYAFGLSHDVAVTKVKPSKTMTGQSCSISINVTVANQGNFTETFNVTIYGNATYIASQNVTLTAGNSATLTFTWNRPGFINGTCAIRAYAWPVPDEINTADNSLMIAPGDVDADGVVDILDVSGLSAHWTGPPKGPLTP